MECLIDAITNNAITDLQTGILDAKFDITQKNKEDLVKKATDCGNVECLKILIQSGYPVSDGWDSPVKPAAAKGNHSYNIEYKSLADLRGAPGTRAPPWGPKFFHFHAVFSKKLKK